METLEDRWQEVEEAVSRAAARSGRKRSDICLVAVSKGRTVEEMESLYSLGVRHFGENRLPEFLAKAPLLPKDIHWHFIGVLQSNKAKKIAENFHTIHSVASLAALKEASKVPSIPELFVQVNVGEEVQKSGIFSDQVDSFLESSLQWISGGVDGLMTIGPQVEDPEESRMLFRRLRLLADQHGLAKVSMGMSGDYEAAIEEGATHVRIGSALFGPASR